MPSKADLDPHLRAILGDMLAHEAAPGFVRNLLTNLKARPQLTPRYAQIRRSDQTGGRTAQALQTQ